MHVPAIQTTAYVSIPTQLMIAVTQEIDELVKDHDRSKYYPRLQSLEHRHSRRIEVAVHVKKSYRSFVLCSKWGQRLVVEAPQQLNV
jgi:hypothetical protein